MKRFTLVNSPLFRLVVLSCVLTGCATTPPEKGSSYTCLQPKLAHQVEAGQGGHGCYFRLFDPASGKVLRATPYRLDVFAPDDKHVVELSGVTDQEGRSGFVRAPFPMTPQRLRFVQTVGEGTLSGGGFRIARPNGKPLSGQPYKLETNCGIEHRGTTDEQGYPVIVRSNTACEIDISPVWDKRG